MAAVVAPRTQRGSAAVEFALMVPVFLFMLFATEEIGRALYEFNVVNKSVRDAAQYLARNCMTAGQVDLAECGLENGAKNLVVFGNPAGTGSPLVKGLTVDKVAVTTPGGTPLRYVNVAVTYTFEPLFPINFVDTGGGIDSPGTFTAAVRMRGL